MSLGIQIVWLFIGAIPIACIAWTVTNEEVFREPREFASKRVSFQKQYWCENCFTYSLVNIVLVIMWLLFSFILPIINYC
jgi:hypothetical protein